MSNYDTDEIIEAFEEFNDYGYVTLECGCKVEADGTCPCGNQSPILEADLI